MAKSKEEQIFIGIDNEVVELTGVDKDAFIADRQARQDKWDAIKAEELAKIEAQKTAFDKLAKLGLTKEEINAIL